MFRSIRFAEILMPTRQRRDDVDWKEAPAGLPLGPEQLDQVAGGMDVQINQVNTAVTSVGDSSVLGAEMLERVVKSVVETLRKPRPPA